MTIRQTYKPWLTGGLYFFMVAGGLWHLLNVFQGLMTILAAPLIILLAIINCLDFYMENITDQGTQTPMQSNSVLLKIASYALLAIVFGYLIELIGMRSGLIFGHYEYSSILRPRIFGVPVAIGFAWLSTYLSSYAIVYRYIKPLEDRIHLLLHALFIASLMVVFDAFMEPSATKLNYWTWQSNHIPLQNYLAWFVISLVYVCIGYRMKLHKLKPSIIMVHIYIAQLIYFLMVLFK